MRTQLMTLVIFATLIWGQAHALNIRSYDANRHDRFSSGYPTAPQPNEQFFLSDMSWSGVGWNQANANQSVALVSPQHFVAANHFHPGVGATLDFSAATVCFTPIA